MFFNGVSTNAYADEFSIVPNRSFKYTDSPNTRGEYAERECARVLDHLFATRSVTAQTQSRIDTHARYGNKRESPPPPRSRRATTRSTHPHPPPATSRTRALTTRDPHERGRQHTSLARIVPAIHSTSASSQILDDERRRHDRLPRPPPARASSTINFTFVFILTSFC